MSFSAKSPIVPCRGLNLSSRLPFLPSLLFSSEVEIHESDHPLS